MRKVIGALGLALVLCGPLAAQDNTQTLADIRQELTVLNVEIQRLRREFSTTGAPNPNLSGSSVLERVDSIEAELQRLTRQTEQLTQRVDRVVADGTNRVGDLEFRLCELEPDCDLASLSEGTTLGGGELPGASAAPAPEPDVEQGGQLAIAEQSQFDAANAALAEGSYDKAARLFAEFDTAYPGSPLAAEAHLNRGRALDNMGDTREAARAYLASFTGDPSGPNAAEALFQLGAALGRLGQVDQACVTLGEVSARFPGAPAVAKATQEMATLNCT
ncbi:tol-pal system protein YbgF [Lutimaribacter marinistellae]|uniref:Cell division coordinator CpoB n=1 Tax=Lutimaribacter marinistellae TaxID=1820329 RepID=A0ABV7TF13_9RHOB